MADSIPKSFDPRPADARRGLSPARGAFGQQAGKDQDFCIKAIKAIQDQQVAQRKAEADKKSAPSGNVSELASLGKWAMVFAGGGALLYVGVKYGLPMLEESKAARKAEKAAT